MTIESRSVQGSLDVRYDSVSFQLRLVDVQSGNYEILREQFGPGKSGQRSYDTVISSREIISRVDKGLDVSDMELRVAEMDRCEFKNEDGARCNTSPTGTVNYDAIGEEQIILVCSREHGDQIARRMEELALIEGSSTFTARNGWGRS